MVSYSTFSSRSFPSFRTRAAGAFSTGVRSHGTSHGVLVGKEVQNGMMKGHSNLSGFGAARRMCLRHALVACCISVFMFCGDAAAPSAAGAQEAAAEPATPVTRQVLQLRRPVERIFPGTSEALLAFDEERKEIQFIDAATGEVADRQKIDGVPLYLAPYYLGPGKWEFLYTQRNDDGDPAFSFGILISRKRGYFTSVNRFNFIPESFKNPAVRYVFSAKEIGIISWDRSLEPSEYFYTIGGFER